MITVRVSSRGRIVIPKATRERFDITPGRELGLAVRDGSIVLTPLPEDPIEFLCGCLEGGQSLTEDLLREHARDLERE